MDRLFTKCITYQRLICVLLVYFCLCHCHEKDSEIKEGFCSKDNDGELESCSAGKDDKYQKHSNLKTTALPLELDLDKVDFNNSKKLKDQGIQHNAVDLSSEMKSLQISILDGVKVGHVQDVEIMPGVTRQIKTLSLHPLIFASMIYDFQPDSNYAISYTLTLLISLIIIEIPDFLGPVECDLIIAMADRKGMSTITSQTTNDGITFEDPDNTFKTWDYNGDGFIDPEEIVLLPGKIDLNFSEKDVLQMFKDLDMDTDANDKLDLDEFKNTSLVKIQEYFNERLSNVDQLRNASRDQVWLWHDEDELLRYQPEIMGNFHERLEAITKIPKEIIQESEPLRVLAFDENSYASCQQDSEPNAGSIPCCQFGDTKQCRLCRFISVTYFLNDVEEGGEMVFPHANSRFEEDIMNNSGNWSGFFSFAKTTGSQSKFNVQLTFKTEGANKVLYGHGMDESGSFEFVDSLVANDVVRFRKKYAGDDLVIKYAGRIKAQATIEGKWWIPGQERMNGNFFMYYTDYEKWMDREVKKCNSRAYCAKGNLVIKPKKGTAIMWYNHMTNDDHWIGALDDKSYHGNCDVIEGEKWVATNWIDIIGDGNLSLTAWKGGKNWLSTANRDKHDDMISKLSSSKPKKEDVIEEMFAKDMADSKLKPTDERPPERYVLNAVTSLLEVLDKNGIKEVSKKVHRKLQMTCIPLFMNQDGRIRIVDGSKED
ncbi:hypothetical protein QZH41_013879 [Actinostola sp. cb2023]|nr:hypothetical protein QZH41_013879 [Actinostola sp. cb2023]